MSKTYKWWLSGEDLAKSRGAEIVADNDDEARKEVAAALASINAGGGKSCTCGMFGRSYYYFSPSVSKSLSRDPKGTPRSALALSDDGAFLFGNIKSGILIYPLCLPVLSAS